MKKIIIAAVVAAVGVSAFGSDCGPKGDEAWAYVWKFTGKTTTGKAKDITTNPCGPGGKDGDCGAYRVPASLKIQGYTYVCSPSSCADDAMGFETQFAEANEVFYMTKPFKASFYGGVTTEIAHIIGKNKKQAEVSGIASLTENNENSTFDLVYSGLGKYDLNNKRLTSANGNFAGTLSQPWVVKGSKDGDVCIRAGYWDCTEPKTLVCEGPSVAYGKWSVKYNKAASKKYANSNDTIKMPSWVEWLNK